MAVSPMASTVNTRPSGLATRAWAVFLVVGALAIGVYFQIPAGFGQAIWAATLGLVTIGAILVGNRLFQPPDRLPWHIIVGAQFLLIAGHLLWGAYVSRAQSPAPVPTLADILYLAHYPLLLLGILLVMHHTMNSQDRVDAIDATIIALGVGVLIWLFLVVPAVKDPALAQAERLVATVYPMMDILVIAVAARLLIAPGERPRVAQLLAGGLIILLATDLWAAIVTLAGPRPVDTLLQCGWLFSQVCFGAAALHPSTRAVTRTIDPAVLLPTRRRLVLLGAAALLAPVVMAVQALRQQPIDTPVIAIVIGLLLLLAWVRMHHLTTTLATTLPRLAHVEGRGRTLAGAAAALVATTTRDEVIAVAHEALEAMARPAGATSTHLLLGNVPDFTVAATAGGTAEQGSILTLAHLPMVVREIFSSTHVQTLDNAAKRAMIQGLGLPRTDDHAHWVPVTMPLRNWGAFLVVSPQPLPEEVAEGIEALAGQVALALERAALASDLFGRHSERRFRSLVQNASDIITVLDRDGTIRYASPSIGRILGLRPNSLDGMPVHTLVHPEDVKTLDKFATSVLDPAQAPAPVEVRMRHRDGSWRQVEATGNNLLGDASVGGIVITWRDITERRRAEYALRESEAHHRAVVDTAFDAIITMNPAGYIETFNKGAERIFGYSAQDMIGRSLETLIPEPWDALKAVGMAQSSHPDDQPGPGRTFELLGRRKDGRTVPLELSFTEVDQVQGGYVTSILRDVSERKAFEEQLTHQAFHDTLTNLANRALFTDRLQHALVQHARRRNTLAVLFVDVDRFKVVNDSLGHDVGDTLLVQVATRLRGCIREGDTAARFGGDEFAILLEEVGGVDKAIRIADRIREAMAAPFHGADHELFLTTSIGIAVNDKETDEPLDLLRYADAAMYRAKQGGRARYAVFDQSMTTATIARLELENDLRHAIDRGEFRVFYQPKVELASGRLAEMEALVRWQHPTRGLVPPLEFIPLAEETGLILQIGEWVMAESCRQTRAWHQAFPSSPQLVISVNLSARQFQQATLIETVARVLRETGLPPSSLKLEITESVIMEDGQATIGKLRELKDLGVKLSIDDFGTGYSSLSYLKRFPVDNLKVDRAFVTGLGRNTEDTAIVQAITTLAHTLGLSVTAEGVETADELAHLHALGCELGQGYFFAKPLETKSAEVLVREGAQGGGFRPAARRAS